MRTARAGRPPGGGDGLTGGLVRGHPERRDKGVATVGPGKADQARVDAGESPRRLERPCEDRIEVDGGADLAELAGTVGLGARLLESRGEVSAEPFGPLERVPEELLDLRVGAPAPAHDDQQDDEGRAEGKARRTDG
jgi:hypothetical protein